MALLQIRLWQLSKLLPPALAAHLEAAAALPVLYASSWLLTCFAADFPLHFAARVMDVILTDSHGFASPMLKVRVCRVRKRGVWEAAWGHVRRRVVYVCGGVEAGWQQAARMAQRALVASITSAPMAC